MTIQHPTKKFSLCPWCGSPGVLRLITADDESWTRSAYIIGCPNDYCNVQPRTKKVYFPSDVNKIGRDWALEEVTKRWENCNCNSRINIGFR